MALTLARPTPAPKSGVRDRLVPPFTENPLLGWAGPLLVTLLGAILRLRDLGAPHAVVFDETYYAREALSLIRHGVERKSVEKPDGPLLAGGENVFASCPQLHECASYVVHPPLGKWTIGLGELLFGVNPFGWRIMAAVFGSLSILILARVARRMTRSTLLGCLAGFLLAIDALHFTLSRIAILDIFLMFWLLAAFACLVADRDWGRSRLAAWYSHSPLGDFGPRLGLRPWRLAAGVCAGAALATKWTAIFFILAFTVLTLLWDAGARRAVGLRRPYVGALKRDLPLGSAWLITLPGVLYVLSHVGWFATEGGWGRNWDQATRYGPPWFVFDSLRSWFSYQTQALSFHTGLTTTHPYMSEPWQWPLTLRPVAFYYAQPAGCGQEKCWSAVLATGTPVIWYGGLAALICMAAWYFTTRDWRAGAVLAMYATGWLPWFYFAIADNRTMYQFYALPMVPFMIIALTLVAGLIIGRAGATPARRATGAAIVGVFALLALANFWWLHPILSAEVIPIEEWRRRLMLPGWE